MNRKTLRTGGKRLFAILCTLFLVVGLTEIQGMRDTKAETEYKELTFSDFGIADGTNTDSAGINMTPTDSSITSIVGTALNGRISFSSVNQYMGYGGPSGTQKQMACLGIRSGYLTARDKQDESHGTSSGKYSLIAGSTGTEYTFRVTFDKAETGTLVTWYIDGEQKAQYISAGSNLTPTLFLYCSTVYSVKTENSEDNGDYKELTFSDFGIADGTNTDSAGINMTPTDSSITSIVGTALNGRISFSSVNQYMGYGGPSGTQKQMACLGIRSGYLTARDKQDESHGTSSGKYSLIAGSTGTEYTFRVTFDEAETGTLVTWYIDGEQKAQYISAGSNLTPTLFLYCATVYSVEISNGEADTNTNFTITSGSYIYQDWSNLNRWAMTFTPSDSLGTPSQLTLLGDYKILVNGAEHSVPYYNKSDGTLQMFIGKSILPQIPDVGTRVTIPAQNIGEDYVLTEDYSIIYDNGWQVCSAYIDTTLSVHPGWSSQNLQATLYPNEAEAKTATLTLKNGSYFNQVTEDAGIWYNGKKLASAPGLMTTVNVDGDYVRYHVVLSNYGLTVNTQDIITIKGLFKNNGVYLNFTEANLKYNGSNWELVSYGYEDLTTIYLDELLYQYAQDTTSLQRWLFKMQPSVVLETATASWGSDYAGYNGNLTVKIYHEDTPDMITTISSTALHAQYNDSNGYFGFIINFTELPKDADGYVMVIEPGVFKSTNYIYQLNRAFTMKHIGGMWEIVLTRPKATGVDGDANGDNKINSIDIVREKRELAGIAGKGGTEICTEDAFLNGKKAMLRKVDLISLYEIILRDGTASDRPIYLADDKIMLAAYEGPRKGNSTDYSYDGETLSSQPVTKSYLNATEFKRFADAGLNTVYVQADSSFDSKALMGANDAMLKNLNTYMELAAEVDVDVIAYSYYLDTFLKEKTIKDWDGNTIVHSTDNVKTEITELWEGHANAKGMREYENFKGIMMSDELDYGYLSNYQNAIDVMSNIHSDIGFYNSQFAMTAAASHFGESNWFPTTDERKTYFLKAATAFGNAAGNFAYDMYPLRTNSSGTNNYVEEYWLYNLQLSAQNAKDNHYDTGITVQSAGQERDMLTMFRAPQARADIGFQIYTALAYGMKSVTYYTYWEHHAQYQNGAQQEKYTMAMVEYPNNPEAENAQGEETPIYYAVQTVNNEINKFDHVFMEYDWEGTIALNVKNNNSLYTHLATYTNDRISSWASTDDALIGCMRDNVQGYDGFWIVNAMDPMASGTNNITVKFNDATRLMIYDPTVEGFDGSAKIIAYDAANGYMANLASGEGQFVIPLK